MTPFRVLFALLVVVPMVFGGFGYQALAEADKSKLEKVERAIDAKRKQQDALNKKSASLESDLKRLKEDSVQAASAIQDHETSILDLEDRLKVLGTAEREKADNLKARRGQFVNVLMAVQKMARFPTEAMIAAPMSPSETVRGAILLRAAVPEIEARTLGLRRDIEELAVARKLTNEKRQQRATELAGLARQQKKMDSLLKQKAKLKSRTDRDSKAVERRMKALVREAKSMRDLIARLDADRRKRAKQTKKNSKTTTVKRMPNPARDISRSRGKLPYPAVGRLVGKYGQTTETGLTRKGITIETRANAQVVAPYDGLVVFAGAFKGYGQLLIIEHGEGYHSLLAGLARIDNTIGQQVLSGEPAGIMGSPKKSPPILYVELRRNGQPINPLPWLAARKSKVNG
ncbi:MAG: peptidoglycan DD-metalloendopeptidase family protein [Rhodospirillaceae bacterium]|jgi:murein hydrolase activator|nr:peptidoglycan DD-metalloendopeptidase family protein [Rhodospirillaceae bacterium]MBT4218445.1 peptidoglycan DD-metalloendopeptidase family protein [Rhodospirillaceae bacterium]MBT4464346.1 peptidoglycan DD-metalloendopeptidase family protein [Rhodospirillaceae bacterium]MBT5014391.1 peptidoglycan DD-metalloendopeptidase family protein [Rhodospirillaceae bacterium]MBT7354967.1 peptidoglycan DD-metalloendopeptidase family protein [Rhodospirillaceae bacterium]